MCNENEQCNSKAADDRPVAKASIGDKQTGYGMINATNKSSPMVSSPKTQRSEKIDMNFDHLSVVSEECLSNGEEQSNKNSTSNNNNNNASTKCDINQNDTLDRIDESIYTNFQSTVPPLKHFENLSYKDIGPNIGEWRANFFGVWRKWTPNLFWLHWLLSNSLMIVSFSVFEIFLRKRIVGWHSIQWRNVPSKRTNTPTANTTTTASRK